MQVRPYMRPGANGSRQYHAMYHCAAALGGEEAGEP